MSDDYYDILGLGPDASSDQIKHAYRRLAQRWHPDRGGSHEMMVRLNEAYFTLSDPARRREYDRIRAGSETAAKAEEQWEQTTSSREAKAEAEQYPRDWEEFDEWLQGLRKDVERAQYRITRIFYPAAGLSMSGWGCIVLGALITSAIAKLFGWYGMWWTWAATTFDLVGEGRIPAGALVGFIVVTRGLGLLAIAFVVLLPALPGAWAGAGVHALIKDVLQEQAAQAARHRTSKSAASGEGRSVVIPCPRCRRRLRLPAMAKPLNARCPRCRHRFEHPPA